jgi:hypothetical protein
MPAKTLKRDLNRSLFLIKTGGEMKKLLIWGLAIYCITIISFFAKQVHALECGVYATAVENTTYSGTWYYIVGIFQSEAEAIAYIQTNYPSPTQQGYSESGYNEMWNPLCYGGYKARICPNDNCSLDNISYFALWPLRTDACPCSGVENTEATQYFTKEKVYNADGDLIYMKIIAADDAGNLLGVYEYGDRNQANEIKSGNQDGIAEENSYYYGLFQDEFNENIHSLDELETELQKDINGDTMEMGLPQNTTQYADYNAVEENEPGVTDPGSETATEDKDYTGQFSAMIENQNSYITNQNHQRSISEQTNRILTEISGKMDNQTTNDQNINVSVNSEVDTTTLEENTGTTASKITQVADDIRAIKEDMDNIETYDPSSLDAQDVDFGENDEEDLEPYEMLKEKQNWAEKVIEVLSTNPFSDALEDVGVEASGDCSVTFYYQMTDHTPTRSIDFTLCNQQDTINRWGSVLLIMSGIHALMVIFRR